jgi:DNA polymerase-3 subunit delta'
MIYPWNKPLWQTLQRRSDGPVGAILLGGPGGLGKRSFARTLAQGILCTERQPGGEPCGRCASCRLFTDESHPDLRLVEPAADEGRAEAQEVSAGTTLRSSRESRAITVSQVRELTDFLIVGSQLGRGKVVLIQPAERLHAGAASALLKTLEEPLPDTAFILVADHPQRLPATVRGRCFRLDFRVPAPETALNWLVSEGLDHPQIALAQSGYAPLAAAELDQGNFWSRRQTFSELFVSPDADPQDIAARMDPGELPLVCQLLHRWCYDLLSLRLARQVRYNPDYAEKLRGLADNADVHQLQRLMQELLAATRALEHPLNPRLVIEHLAIGYTRMIARQHH